jgi:hypothetical protein
MNRAIRVVLIAFAASTACLSTNITVAGEVNGKGEYIHGDDSTPLPGKSECAYSGRQDNYAEDVTPIGPFFRSMIVQNWGQVTEFFKSILPAEAHPGTSCNPKKSGGGA